MSPDPASIIVVDEHDEVIGSKLRGTTTHDDIYRISALWLRNGHGKVLLAQRKLTKAHNPGLWGPAVAGTVEVGESYEDNIYKEAEEEIGLTGVKFDLGPKKFRDAQDRRSFCQWFLATVNRDIDQFTIQEEEVEQIRWIDETELWREIKEQPEKYIPGTAVWKQL